MGQYTFKPGERLIDCTIMRGIGRGAFAEVYLAECERWKRVALKYYFDPNLSREDLLNEAFTLAMFNHLGYHVEVYYAYPFAPYYFLIMEFMESGNLRERLEDKGRLPLEEAIKITYQIGQALKLMHERGFFHRDVCPENIFLDEKGNAKLGDLGCAVFHKNPKTAYAVGHKPYIAPEVIKEKPHTAQSDIYSLGRVFYEMLVGKLPYEDEIRSCLSLEELRELLNQGKFDIKWPKDLKISALIKEIISKLTAISPNDRYENIDEMLSPLLYFLGESETYVETYSNLAESLKEEKKPDLTYLKSIFIAKKDPFIASIKEKREREAMEKFYRLLETNLDNLFKGLRDKMGITFYRAINESLKFKNCYLGLEHIFLAMGEENLFAQLLQKRGQSLSELKEEIRRYTEYNRVYDVKRLLSPRFEKVLANIKQSFPEGVGEKEFLIKALEEKNLVSILLEEKGINVENFVEEVKAYEI